MSTQTDFTPSRENDLAGELDGLGITDEMERRRITKALPAAGGQS